MDRDGDRDRDRRRARRHTDPTFALGLIERAHYAAAIVWLIAVAASVV
jgi:hypothetical protein